MDYLPLFNAALRHGYDINKQSNHGRKIKKSSSQLGYTALLYAATSNNLERVKFLFQKGAKVINSDYLHHFLWTHCSNVEILELMYQNGLDLLYQVAGQLKRFVVNVFR